MVDGFLLPGGIVHYRHFTEVLGRYKPFSGPGFTSDWSRLGRPRNWNMSQWQGSIMSIIPSKG